uniref:C2H2-type domain-containing protein n=1 Tax=Caenorhabditis tropicalis TaxID=1561998 RepID=A0A1I7TFT4_9PELO
MKNWFQCIFPTEPMRKCRFIGTLSDMLEHMSAHLGIYRIFCEKAGCARFFHDEAEYFLHMPGCGPDYKLDISNDVQSVTFKRRCLNIYIVQLAPEDDDYPSESNKPQRGTTPAYGGTTPGQEHRRHAGRGVVTRVAPPRLGRPDNWHTTDSSVFTKLPPNSGNPNSEQRKRDFEVAIGKESMRNSGQHVEAVPRAPTDSIPRDTSSNDFYLNHPVDSNKIDEMAEEMRRKKREEGPRESHSESRRSSRPHNSNEEYPQNQSQGRDRPHSSSSQAYRQDRTRSASRQPAHTPRDHGGSQSNSRQKRERVPQQSSHHHPHPTSNEQFGQDRKRSSTQNHGSQGAPRSSSSQERYEQPDHQGSRHQERSSSRQDQAQNLNGSHEVPRPASTQDRHPSVRQSSHYANRSSQGRSSRQDQAPDQSRNSGSHGAPNHGRARSSSRQPPSVAEPSRGQTPQQPNSETGHSDHYPTHSPQTHGQDSQRGPWNFNGHSGSQYSQSTPQSAHQETQYRQPTLLQNADGIYPSGEWVAETDDNQNPNPYSMPQFSQAPNAPPGYSQYPQFYGGYPQAAPGYPQAPEPTHGRAGYGNQPPSDPRFRQGSGIYEYAPFYAPPPPPPPQPQQPPQYPSHDHQAYHGSRPKRSRFQ